jgi:hypothetical protein
MVALLMLAAAPIHYRRLRLGSAGAQEISAAREGTLIQRIMHAKSAVVRRIICATSHAASSVQYNVQPLILFWRIA